MIAAVALALLAQHPAIRPLDGRALDYVHGVRMPANVATRTRCEKCGEPDLAITDGLCAWCHRAFVPQQRKSEPPRDCWPHEPVRVVPLNMERGAYRRAIAELRKRQRRAQRA